MNYKKLFFILGCGIALGLGEVNGQSTTFNYTGSIQMWTVPSCVTQITIEALGAQGGSTMGENNSGPYIGGLGADIKGAFTVIPGQSISILVGQEGSAAPGSFCTSGGGGGSWAVLNSTLLLVAGGGGGGFMCNALGGAIGGNGNAINDGSSGISACPCRTAAAGGTGGNGGTSCYGGGGGGWLTAGTSTCSGAGGGAYPGAIVAGGGGYGGGGGGYNTGCCGGSGGGGGYSGGSGGTSDGCAGGGGGSYNIGSNQTNTAGVQSGNGEVTITWALPAALTASASISTNISCNGENNGGASSTVTGGSTPYTYAWTGGGTNATVSGLTAGSYTVTVHDACGNTASASVSITQPTAIVATITSTNVLCNGGNSGSASSTVTGGTGAYTYAWTGGGSNSSITGLTAGTYNLNVQDANGCTGSATVTITQPNMLVVSDSVTDNVLCHGDTTGSASSRVSGGTMPYTYAWTGGGTTDTAVGLKAGTYTLSVQDANGCTGTAMVTITEPSALSIVKHATADNGSHNGKAWVNVSGGVSPYTYLWTGGNTTDSISLKGPGTYCCTVKDANGCMDSVCIFIVSTEGVDGITSDGGQITVYPNPNNGQFTIQSSLNAVSTVEVYNVLGEKVFSGNLNAGNNTINISNQSNGVYLYRVMSESGALISEGKISVQK